MSRIQFDLSKLLLLMVLCSVWAGAAWAQDTVSATAEWNLPAGDYEIDHFIVQHSQDGGAWVTVGEPQAMELTFDVAVDASHRFRVASVIAGGVQSAFSDPSPELIPDSGALDPPGAPGQPIVF